MKGPLALPKFNLPGPDLAVADYAKLLDGLAAQRVVFVNTASSSGAFVQPLAGPGRIIVTATKTGGERNETRFPAYFVEAYRDEAADRDRNGRVSALEAFDYARKADEEGRLLQAAAAADFVYPLSEDERQQIRLEPVVTHPLDRVGEEGKRVARNDRRFTMTIGCLDLNEHHAKSNVVGDPIRLVTQPLRGSAIGAVFDPGAATADTRVRAVAIRHALHV